MKLRDSNDYIVDARMTVGAGGVPVLLVDGLALSPHEARWYHVLEATAVEFAALAAGGYYLGDWTDGRGYPICEKNMA